MPSTSAVSFCTRSASSASSLSFTP
jgi:hypothetical protein